VISTWSALAAVLVAGTCGYLLGKPPRTYAPPQQWPQPCPTCGEMHETPDALAECNHLSAEDNYRRQVDELNRAAKKKKA
jgi:hypothetical protein